MLALATGWTPDVIGDVPQPFRAALHWALYAGAISGPEGLPSTDLPRNASHEQRVALQEQRVHVLKMRDHLYPEDEG